MLNRSGILNFTTLYRVGRPVTTGMTTLPVDEDALEPIDAITRFDCAIDEYGLTLTHTLFSYDRVYGLGQTLGGLNKRGKVYRLYATDDPVHTPDKECLYGCHPFLIVEGMETFGVLLDYPAEITIDIGFTQEDLLRIRIANRDIDIYVFDGQGIEIKDIVREFLTLTGSPYVPPKWAFGYHQSRWSYPDEKSITELGKMFRQKGFPCDAIYMDIDYMDNYKVFTISEERFVDFERFVASMKRDGFRLVPIIDPAVKVERGYGVCQEGIDNGHFCRSADGDLFVAAVWPGFAYLPDFHNRNTRKWWGDLHKRFIEAGIEGFWNDMNEPSIFYTPQAVNELYDTVQYMRQNGFDKDAITSMSNRPEYFQDIVHTDDAGNPVPHNSVHNLYGFNMAQATVEGFNRYMPGQRYFLLSRSSCTGTHRVAGIWTGDNMSWWEHLLSHIRMLMSLNITGFFYCGADIGGFGCNAHAELMVRWMQLGVFSPLCRNHSAMGTRYQEPWGFGHRAFELMREAIRLRYALLPYTYSEYMRCVRELEPFISPLFDATDVEDQFMYGNSIMVAPIYQPNARGRYVTLPRSAPEQQGRQEKTRWLLWRCSRYDVREMKVYDPGVYYVGAELGEMLIFIREDTLVTLTHPVEYIGQTACQSLTVIGFVSDKATFSHYEDDGSTFKYREGCFSTLDIVIERDDDDYAIMISRNEHEAVPIVITEFLFEIYDESGQKVYRRVAP
ncbi:Alpha-glucosidase, family 31 [Candidatus Magnetobacterium bavaricum]|uniref:Alpha-glucosidase, family 31 n=1 Tax=Candidatus Magnetobacterium bavaricum TaxID=29290 RepID=A0A0F3GZS5_9BACT|nr:Alpha-glucosidase, family 31 [Candidatus Magnetobacterium bavaricum]